MGFLASSTQLPGTIFPNATTWFSKNHRKVYSCWIFGFQWEITFWENTFYEKIVLHNNLCELLDCTLNPFFWWKLFKETQFSMQGISEGIFEEFIAITGLIPFPFVLGCYFIVQLTTFPNITSKLSSCSYRLIKIAFLVCRCKNNNLPKQEEKHQPFQTVL